MLVAIGGPLDRPLQMVPGLQRVDKLRPYGKFAEFFPPVPYLI
jgi:hypothetical protein